MGSRSGFRLTLLCLAACAAFVATQEISFEDDKFLFTVENAADLLNGKVLGRTLDDVLDEGVAKMLEDAGFKFSDEAISFKVGVDNERVSERKCLYTSELRDAHVDGEIDVGKKLEFKADQTFLIHASAVFPLDMTLSGTLHTDIFVPLAFKCPQVKDVEFPVTTDILTDVKVNLEVFLNPTVLKRKGKVFLKVKPEIKIMEEVTNLVSSSNVEFQVFDKVRVKFVEGLLEGIADEAIQRKGAEVISKQVTSLKDDLQEFVDNNLSGKKINLGDLIDDVEAAGVLEDLVLLARIAFEAL